ncbi:hypothetical protein Poly24_51630 [Rosistilla carotiformis]|uniref:HTTM domain-containing protein n=1 Tax=Rosistilla carotiformis TaxID=2528017 RepID=A0A518K0W6_9BACT|nr:hypothetical protein [Rosistilla carotiformis]QDV71427.1 hypothetical protein Poly24_51630 [Rosistilla carotiformis]
MTGSLSMQPNNDTDGIAEKFGSRNAEVQFAIRLVALLVVGTFATNAFRLVRKIESSVFEEPWMLAGTLGQFWGMGMFTIAVASLCMLLSRRWSSVEQWHSLRWVVIPTIAIFTWCYSTYDFNFFLQQQHLIDRSSLVLLGLASIWRPAFLGAFLFQLGTILAHLGHPLPFSWTDKSPLIDILVVANVFLLGWRFRIWRSEHFLIVVVYIVAIHYFRPGVGKLAIGWFSDGHLSNLFLNAVYQNEWLPGCGTAEVSLLAKRIASADYLLKAMTLLVELLPLLFLLHRKVLIVGLVLAVGLHFGIYLSSGILFWKWIVLDFSIAVTFGTLSKTTADRLFNRNSAIGFGISLCVGFVLYVSAPVLAWYDAPLAFHYHLQVTGASGQTYQIPPSSLAPFDLQFAQGRLAFLEKQPLLVDCLGSCTSRPTLYACRDIDSAVRLAKARDKFGVKRFDKMQATNVEQLLRRYVNNWNHGVPRNVFDWIPDPPQHISTFPQSGFSQAVWNCQEAPKQITILRTTAFHRDFKTTTIEDRIVHTIDVATPPQSTRLPFRGQPLNCPTINLVTNRNEGGTIAGATPSTYTVYCLGSPNLREFFMEPAGD